MPFLLSPSFSFWCKTFLCGDSTSDQCRLTKNERHLEDTQKVQSRLVFLFMENSWNIHGLMGTGTEDQLRHKYHAS